MGRPSGLVCFGCSCWNRWRGSMLPPNLVSFLTQTEAVPLLLALVGSLMTVYTSLHCWELMLSVIISFGCMSPTIPQSIAATNRSLCGGLFSVLALAACGSPPFSWFFEMGLMTWHLWTSGVTPLAFCSPVTLFFHNLCMPSHGQGSCFYQDGVDGCSWGMVCRMSVAWDHVSGGCGVWCIPHVLHTFQLLLTPQHSMFCRSLAGAIPSCHSWPSEVVCAAWCLHLGLPKSACIELQILLQHHCHCPFVPCRWVGISNLLAHRWIYQTSLWCLLAHGHGLMGRSCHLVCSLCSLRTSLGHSCVLHLLVPICPWQHSPLCSGCRVDNQGFPQPWSCKFWSKSQAGTWIGETLTSGHWQPSCM